MDADDRHHTECVELLRSHRGPLIVPTLVVTEVAYLVASRLGHEPEVRLLGDVAAGTFIAEPIHPGDWIRIAELVATYHDLALGTVDASVVAACERLEIEQLATLDRRDFEVVRPHHTRSLMLRP